MLAPLPLPHSFYPISLPSYSPTEIQALIALGLVTGVSETQRMPSVYLGADEVLSVAQALKQLLSLSHQPATYSSRRFKYPLIIDLKGVATVQWSSKEN